VLLLPYPLWTRLRRSWRFERLYRRWLRARGRHVGSREHLPHLVAAYASGKSFVDAGGMWGIDGENTFAAARAGATRAVLLDIMPPTDRFNERQRETPVEYVQGDITDSRVVDRIGVVDVVLCSGVLYHHPSPYEILLGLRRLCRETLILSTATIPEMALPGAAIYLPGLAPRDRCRWLGTTGAPSQLAVGSSFRPDVSYANWFWLMTPSCVRQLLETAGFQVVRHEEEAFGATFVAAVVGDPMVHTPDIANIQVVERHIAPMI
jgi:SAM-dependent methyltransferase